MNRRITGIVAWCALGLVVAIPGTDVLLKNSGDTNTDVAQAEPTESVQSFGPELPGGNVRPRLDLSAEDIASMLQPPLPEAGGPDSSVASTQETMPPKILPSIVPLGVAKPKETEIAKVVTPEVLPVAPLDTIDTEIATMPETILSDDVIETGIDVAAFGSDEISAIETEDAPAPMPVDIRPRPATNVIAGRQDALRELPSLEDDVRSSINVIETSRRPLIVHDVPVNDRFWGDNPQHRNGRRLDSFSSEEIARADDASDSQFYELWADDNRPVGFRPQGSFSDQLPARRGSSVRLDLLQGN